MHKSESDFRMEPTIEDFLKIFLPENQRYLIYVQYSKTKLRLKGIPLRISYLILYFMSHFKLALQSL